MSAGCRLRLRGGIYAVIHSLPVAYAYQEVPEMVAWTEALSPGGYVAGYQILEQAGQGGMAIVFRAHDSRLNRTVALKILAPALAADAAFRARFIRESQAASAIDDPHIIPVYEAGEADG